MKLLLILSFVCYSFAAQSQVQDVLKQKRDEETRRKLLMSHPELKLPPQLKKYSFNNTKQTEDPAVVHTPLTGNYIGNNGKGANVYAMEPYKMPCLVPDDTFVSNMPVGGPSKYKMVNKLPELEKPSVEDRNKAEDDLTRRIQ